MCTDFAILFVYIFADVSWVFTVTLAGWYEKGPSLGPRSRSTIYQQLGPWESHLNISGSQFLSAKRVFALASLQGPFLLDPLSPYTSL